MFFYLVLISKAISSYDSGSGNNRTNTGNSGFALVMAYILAIFSFNNNSLYFSNST